MTEHMSYDDFVGGWEQGHFQVVFIRDGLNKNTWHAFVSGGETANPTGRRLIQVFGVPPVTP